MQRADAVAALEVLHIEDGDLLVILGRHARKVLPDAIAILQQRGFDHCGVLAGNPKDIDVRLLDREQMRALGWVRIEEAEALGITAVPADQLDRFYVTPDDLTSQRALSPLGRDDGQDL